LLHPALVAVFLSLYGYCLEKVSNTNSRIAKLVSATIIVKTLSTLFI
jgi:hypothetical protein